MAQTLTVGSLFSGIGGLDLGLERAGMRVIWQSEIDPYANKVLKKHWPEVPNLGNIKDIDWQSVERPAVICGGYPCQPFSTAGHRKGEEDSRHLWPWVREAISELRPRYAILENVRGHLSLGGTTVIADLAAIGYDAEWRIVSAASVGANHRRDRIIIVAYPNNSRWKSGTGQSEPKLDRCGANEAQCRGTHTINSRVSTAENVADTNSGGMERSRPEQQTTGLSGTRQNVAYPNNARSHCAEINATKTGVNAFGGFGRCGDNVAYPDAREIGGRSGGIQQGAGLVFGGDNYRRGTQGYAGWQWWETEPDVGRVANGVPNRVDRLRGLGNAVVPQVAEVIGRLVVEHATHN